jgi:hypothetical protein
MSDTKLYTPSVTSVSFTASKVNLPSTSKMAIRPTMKTLEEMIVGTQEGDKSFKVVNMEKKDEYHI